ncbi:hypothetical protein Cpir12675_001686 [Ceratocystis pirilliformis]|uniref:Uncharacterized protein n=1 Tax=Ceratocystis pirilliformis TaxID=259994 RepID=A0ABR3ZGL1_9PEZI
MFDVVWTDPQRESVGERRARKEIERRQKTTDAARTSVCTGTTSSSERPSEKSEHTTFSSLFSSRTIRRVARNASKNRPLSPSIQAPGSSDDSKRKISFFGLDSISSNKNSGKAGSMTSQSSFQPSVRNIDTDLSISRSESRAHLRLSFGHDSISNISDSGPGPSTLSNRKLRSAQDIIQVVIPDSALADGIMAEVPEIEDPTSPVSRDSVFSKWTTPSVYTQSTAFDLAFETSHQYGSSMDNKYSSHTHKSGQSSITTLGSKPFAVRRQSKDYDPDVLKPKSASSFKGDSSSTGRPPTPPETPQNQQTHNISLQPIIYDNDDFEDDSHVDDQSSAVTSIKTIDLQDFPVNFRLSASHSPGSLSGWIQAFGPNDQASWKTPDEWEDEPEKNNTIASKVNVDDLLADEDTLPHHPPPREPTLVEQFQALQDSTKTMKSACDKTILFALNRNWGSEQDATVYREMEMEKKRWMLTAIHSISQEEERKPLPTGLVVKSSHAGRIMCLFESPGVASFVSTSNPTKQVFFVTNNSAYLSPAYGNVVPIQLLRFQKL